MPSRFVTLLVVCMLGSAGLAGCSKEQILGWFGKSESTTPSVAGGGKTATPANQAPFFELKISPEFKFTNCFAQLDTFNDGKRPTVLRISSYEFPESETFPSFLLYAHTPGRSLGALVDQEIEASFYATTGEQETVYHHVDGENGTKLKIKITEVTENGIAGQIVGGNIQDTFSRAPQSASGSFFARTRATTPDIRD